MKLSPQQLQALIDEDGASLGEVVEQLVGIISELRGELRTAHAKVLEMADRPMPTPVQLPAPPAPAAPPAQIVKIETRGEGEKPPRVWNLTINRDKEGRMTGVRCEAWLNSK